MPETLTPGALAKNEPLVLRTIRRVDLRRFHGVLLVLSVISVLLGPHPLSVGLLVSFAAVGWYWFGNRNWRLTETDVSVSIYPDGAVRLRYTNGQLLKGQLANHQWLTQQVAVLQVLAGKNSHHLVFFAFQQSGSNYRRLMVLLKQGR